MALPIRKILMWAAVAIVAIVVVSVAGCGIKVVDTGQRGIKTRFGKVVSESLPEGLYFFNPITSDIVEIDTRVQRQDGETDTYTRDVQQAAHQVHAQLPPAAERGAPHVSRHRPRLGAEADSAGGARHAQGSRRQVGRRGSHLQSRQGRRRPRSRRSAPSLAERNVEVSRFEITDIAYTKEFENSVEQKVIAQQKAIEEQNRTKQIEEQARQKVLSAEAEAKSMQIRAEALEQNAKLVEWEAVQKWNGVLPQYMLGSGATPFINLTPGKN